MAAYVRRIMLAALAVILYQLSAVAATYGCMCLIEHPQQKFCHAEFVITGRMVNMEWLLIPRIIPTEEPWVETTPQPQNWGSIQEIDLDKFPRGGDFDEGNGLHLGPLQQNDDPLGGRQRSPNNRRQTQIPNSHGSHGNPSAQDEFMMEPRNYNVIYEIEVDQVYKESDRVPMSKGEVIRILAPPPQRSFPMCSYSAMRMKRLYLFAVQNSDMMTACDWVEEFRSLTSKQKQGLKGSYGRGCDICQINLSQSGMWQNNPALNSNSTCMAEMDGMMVTFPDYTKSDCYAMHSHCVQKKLKCKWYSSKDFKKCKRNMREDADAEGIV